MKLTERDVSFILTVLMNHHRDLRDAKGPGPMRERVETHRLIQKFEALENESRHSRRR